jgi:hypothetical protein
VMGQTLTQFVLTLRMGSIWRFPPWLPPIRKGRFCQRLKNQVFVTLAHPF